MSKQSILKKIALYLSGTLFIGVSLVAAGLALTDNNYVYRGLQLTYMKGQTTASIDDYASFDNNKISAGIHQAWQKHPTYGKFKLSDELKQFLDNDETVAFAVIKDGTLLYENYWHGYTADSKINSFSMAKSITTMLYLKAVEDGYISSYDEPLTKLLPEYANNEFAEQCTLADLSAMTAGYDWVEEYYFPINPTAKAYYGKDLIDQILNRDFIEPCGSFKYSSGNTQLLGIALQRALEPHGLSISSYLQQSFWQPLGMKDDAYWSLDGSAEIEKTYCCINANSLDFAKFGQLLLNHGKWADKQLLSAEHVKLMVTPNAESVPVGDYIPYGHSIWTDMSSPVPFYAMVGHLGQRVVVIPDENIIIVRLGREKAKPAQIEGFNMHNTDVPFYVMQVIKSLNKSTVIK